MDLDLWMMKSNSEEKKRAENFLELKIIVCKSWDKNNH